MIILMVNLGFTSKELTTHFEISRGDLHTRSVTFAGLSFAATGSRLPRNHCEVISMEVGGHSGQLGNVEVPVMEDTDDRSRNPVFNVSFHEDKSHPDVSATSM